MVLMVVVTLVVVCTLLQAMVVNIRPADLMLEAALTRHCILAVVWVVAVTWEVVVPDLIIEVLSQR